MCSHSSNSTWSELLIKWVRFQKVQIKYLIIFFLIIFVGWVPHRILIQVLLTNWIFSENDCLLTCKKFSITGTLVPYSFYVYFALLRKSRVTTQRALRIKMFLAKLIYLSLTPTTQSVWMYWGWLCKVTAWVQVSSINVNSWTGHICYPAATLLL